MPRESGVDGATAPVFRSYAARVSREGERERERKRELVVDVGRLATTRDRPSALATPSSPRLGGHRERVEHHPRFVVSAVRDGGGVPELSTSVCENVNTHQKSRVGTISSRSGVGYRGWKVKWRTRTP